MSTRPILASGFPVTSARWFHQLAPVIKLRDRDGIVNSQALRPAMVSNLPWAGWCDKLRTTWCLVKDWVDLGCRGLQSVGDGENSGGYLLLWYHPGTGMRSDAPPAHLVVCGLWQEPFGLRSETRKRQAPLWQTGATYTVHAMQHINADAHLARAGNGWGDSAHDRAHRSISRLFPLLTQTA